MRGAVPLLLLGAAALLASCAAQGKANCNLGDPAGLSQCLKQLLIDARPMVAEKADPLRLPNHNDGDLEATNIRIHGISGYSVVRLSVRFPRERQIAVSARISWPRVKGKLDVKLTMCKKILSKNRCITVRAKVDIDVGRTVSSLATTMSVNVAPGGQITVTARGTDIKLNLASIKVKANVQGAISSFNRLFGDPASKITTWLANKWWRENKGKIEAKAEDALDKAIREKVTAELSKVLKLLKL